MTGITDYPTPDGRPVEVPLLSIAHLSDTHLTSPGTLYNGSLDADALLIRAIDVLQAADSAGRGVDIVVVSGDLTDSGDPENYRRLAELFAPLRADVLWATGNHDVRAVFHRELLQRDDSGPVLRVYRRPDVRVIVLDSTVVGEGQGRLEPGHLDELRAELATPHPVGSIVVLHHAPISPPSPLLTFFALERRSREELRDALAGTDVRLILAGHHHLAGSGMLGSVPVVVAGSTAIRTDPLAEIGHERTVAAGSFNIVRWYADGWTNSVIPIDDARQVFDLDPEQCAAVIAANPIS